ncbi:hypothetical protein [Amycolatopsis australiensis]|uniref:hypothetical protein n=1 Tax=Amycolatopsis australiensis TaxID=546364 RepID=UPI001160F911|nr:hypothetical protein [Amycolatopsis australiensis]
MAALDQTLPADSLAASLRPFSHGGARMHHSSLRAPRERGSETSVFAGQRRDAHADALTREGPAIVDSRTAAVIERARRLAADLQRRIIGITHSQLPAAELASKERDLGMLLHDVGEELMTDADRIDPGVDHAE